MCNNTVCYFYFFFIHIHILHLSLSELGKMWLIQRRNRDLFLFFRFLETQTDQGFYSTIKTWFWAKSYEIFKIVRGHPLGAWMFCLNVIETCLLDDEILCVIFRIDLLSRWWHWREGDVNRLIIWWSSEDHECVQVVLQLFLHCSFLEVQLDWCKIKH